MRISDWSSDVCSSDLTRAKALEVGEGIGCIALPVKVEEQHTMPGISQHPRQVTSDHRLAGAALLHINGNGLHALPTPIRIVVPMVIAAIVGIGSRVATRLLIRRVAAPNARITAATAPKDGPTNQDE